MRVDFYAGTTLLGTDTTAPYRFTWKGVRAGVYAITARATDNTGRSATSAPVAFPIAGEAAMAVGSFTLIDATTHQPVPGYEQIPAGAVLERSRLPAALNVRVNPTAPVGSVRLGLDGNPVYRTESVKPYALFADTNGRYWPGTFTTGVHTLTALPYTGAGGTGTAGAPLSLTFTVR